MIASSNRPSSPQKKRAGASSRKLSGDRAALVKRMWRAAEAQVGEIEDRLSDNVREPLERERDARMLAVLAKTLRELSALDAAKSAKQLAPADDDAVPRDMDELRRSLARKLEALVARQQAGVPDET